MVCVSTVVECGRLTVVRSVVVVFVTWLGVVRWVLTLMQLDTRNGATSASRQIAVVFILGQYAGTK